MAIATSVTRKSLKLELDGGIVNGKQKVVSKSFNSLKADAQDTNIHTCGVVLADLQEKDLLNVKRLEEVIITEE